MTPSALPRCRFGSRIPERRYRYRRAPRCDRIQSLPAGLTRESVPLLEIEKSSLRLLARSMALPTSPGSEKRGPIDLPTRLASQPESPFLLPVVHTDRLQK